MTPQGGEPINTQPAKKSSAEAEARERSRGGFSTKIHVPCVALGNPLEIALTPGQAGDSPQEKLLLANVLLDSETPRIGAVLGDKGYDSNDHLEYILEYIASLEAEALIPPKKNRLEQREISLEPYKDRNKIERFINRIMHYRRVETRYEKTARNCMAVLHLVSALVWLL